jgi:hypothetical protein
MCISSALRRVIQISLISLLLSGCAVPNRNYVPTPKHAISIDFGMDKSTEWIPDFMNGNSTSIIMEWVPKGQNVNAWNELVTNKIWFYNTSFSLENHLAGWERDIRNSDPKVDIREEKLDDGSILVTYVSSAFNEYSMWHFIRGNDGVYAFGYGIRLSNRRDDRINLWKEILIKACLVSNPVYK